MTARRATAAILLLIILCTYLPVPAAQAAYEGDNPSYVPMRKIKGSQALGDGNLAYVVNDVTYDLECYDLSTTQLVSSVGGRELVRLTKLNHLYAVDDMGILYTYDQGPQGLQEIRRIRIHQWDGNYLESWQQGPLARLDDQRMLTMTKGKLYVFDEQSGTTEWSYESGSYPHDDFVKFGDYAFVVTNPTYRYLTGIAIGGDKAFGTRIYSSTLPALDPSGEPALYFISDSKVIVKLYLDAEGNIVTEDFLNLQSAQGYLGGDLTIHAGKLYYSVGKELFSCDLKTKAVEHYQAKVTGALQWLGEDSDTYRMVGGGITEVRDDQVTFSTALPDHRFGDLMASSDAGFVVRDPIRNDLWIYAKSDEILPARSLTYGQSHVIVMQHDQAGPISFNLALSNPNPALIVDVQYMMLNEWRPNSWYVDDVSQVKDAGYSVYEQNLPAGPVAVVITADSVDERYDADSLARHPDWATPFTYQLTCGLGVEPDAGEIPNLRITDPWPRLELWGADSSTATATVNLQADPYTWVYFLNGQSMGQADANGDIAQVLPLGSGLVSTIQAVAGTGDNSAAVTVPVYRHWVLQPPGEAPWLNRYATINLVVPDVKQVNMQYSQLKVNGRLVPLVADTKTNRLYGVPNFALPTGTVRFTLTLAGYDQQSREPILLDELGWNQEIIGSRTAELWPGKTTATLNGAAVALDASPYVHTASSSTMLPFRFIGEVMGAQVNWDAKTKQVTFKLDDKTVVLTIGSRAAKVNGKSVTMATAPTLVGSRTMVPLRFVSENLGAKVDWDSRLRKVTIKVG